MWLTRLITHVIPPTFFSQLYNEVSHLKCHRPIIIFQPPTPDLTVDEEGCANPAEQYVLLLEISPPPPSADRGVRGGAVPLTATPHTSCIAVHPPHPCPHTSRKKFILPSIAMYYYYVGSIPKYPRLSENNHIKQKTRRKV